MAVDIIMGIKEVTTSYFDPQTNGGTERVNHTIAQMPAVAVNERPNDWGVRLPHVAFAFTNTSVRQASGLSSNDIRLERLPSLLPSVFDHPSIVGHQSWDRDCNLAVDCQRQAYALVRDCSALTVFRVERRNSALFTAVNKLRMGFCRQPGFGFTSRPPRSGKERKIILVMSFLISNSRFFGLVGTRYSL